MSFRTIEIRDLVFFCLHYTGCSSHSNQFMFGPFIDSALILKNPSSMNKTRYSVHKSTEWNCTKKIFLGGKAGCHILVFYCYKHYFKMYELWKRANFMNQTVAFQVRCFKNVVKSINEFFRADFILYQIYLMASNVSNKTNTGISCSKVYCTLFMMVW